MSAAPRSRPLRLLRIAGWILLGLVAAIALMLALFDWNLLRRPLERLALEQTGRELAIGGDLRVRLGWPLAHVEAGRVTFANPAWTKERQMLSADAVNLAIDLPALLALRIDVPEAELRHPVIALERGPDGRANWHLDRLQATPNTHIRLGLLRVDDGNLHYDDLAQQTAITAHLATARTTAGAATDGGLQVEAIGQLKGFPLTARGSGGPALALDAGNAPYPVEFEATMGRTWVRGQGTVTGLLALAAIDLRLAVRGDSLDQLFPQLGMALPATHAFDLSGRLVHDKQTWRYEKFAGRIGQSDLAGTLQVDTGGARPFLHGELVSGRLDFVDLGPMVGKTQVAPAASAPAAPPAKARAQAAGRSASARPSGRVLPTEPYAASHWTSLDADVKFSARTIHRAQALPLDNLSAEFRLRDGVLMLDPLDFGVAGGDLGGTVTLDGNQKPIRAVARLHARKMLLGKLLPTMALATRSIGQLDGEIDLAGSGDAVDGMLATADGTINFRVGEGKVSQLLMEQIGLHLPEILALKITGDKIVAIRCGIADFRVKQGTMVVHRLMLDTEVTRIRGSGTVDLAQEQLALTLTPETKNTSLVALRAPIHVRGTFGAPVVSIDTAQVAARGLGAVALGLINPFLALVPLVDAGPGKDADCGRVAAGAQGASTNAPRRAAREPATRTADAHPLSANPPVAR